MPLLVNLRHLESDSIRLKGELPVAELDVDARDEVIRANQPLQYDLELEKMEEGLLVQGHLRLALDCQCVRCLKSFQYQVDLPHWAVHLPLGGEDPVSVVNDCVDLTPWVREDILLDFPRHPLCNADCRGLPGISPGKGKNASGASPKQDGSAPWSELNKLKF
jgi:uncharacterized metal-binding protein YceD (DUF177 family)